MAHYSANNIKTHVSITEYLQRIGTTLKKVGSNTFNAETCPLCGHKDCFRVEVNKDLWKCFSCGRGGDLIELHALARNLEFVDACASLGEMFNLKPDPAPEQSKPSTPQNPHAAILDAAMSYYRAQAVHSSPFHRFCTLRNLDEPRIKAFGLGYADGGLMAALMAKGYTEAELLEANVCRKDEKTGNIYDFFRNHVIFPYQDREGTVIHLKGKGIDRMGKSRGKPYQLPLGDRGRPFFGMQHAPKETLYVVEGEMDAISCRKIGLCAWAMGGNPSDDQLNVLRRQLSRGVKLVLVPDHDDAGEKYAARFRDLFFSQCLPPCLRKTLNFRGEVVRGTFPDEYNDIDEAIRDTARRLDHIGEAPLYPALKACLNTYYKSLSNEDDGLKYSVDVVARTIYEYFAGFGQFFVVDDACYLIFRGHQYHIDNSMPFKALMYDLAGINYASGNAKPVWEAIKANCYNNARHSRGASWIFCDHEAKRVFYNPCNEQNHLILMDAGGVQSVPNGSNAQGVFLFQSPKTLPITYQIQDESGPLDELFHIFTRYTATSAVWQAYLICLVINTFIIQFAKARGINKFSGHQGSGKTEAAGLITTLLYGQNFVTISSTASDYTDAALNPVTVCDNLELSSIVEDRKNFLLCVATGITRQKRKSGTDSQNVYEKAVTQLITTSIESFELPELIERTMVIPFSSRHFKRDYPGAVTIENHVIRHRNAILSAVFRLTGVMLNDFDAKKARWTAWLQERFPQHAKKRLNEHLACMALSLETFLDLCPKALTHFGTVERVVSEWIAEQDRENDETMQETSIIVRFLNMLDAEWQNKKLPDYGLESDVEFAVAKNSLQFECTNETLLSAFSLLAKKYQLPQPFKSVRHMAVRIRNEQAILEKSGWMIYKSRTVRGKRLYVFANYPLED